MTKPILLITGATGNQGGATVHALLAGPDRWRLRALARNPAAPKAQALARKGVEVVRGDLHDTASVQAALDGVHGVYSVQTPMEQGTEGEERQGKLLASLAAEADVRHFVYSSAGGAERNSGVPHFDSKRAIERHVEGLGLPATILRPAAFMDNFASLSFRAIMMTMWKTYMPDHRALQLVAVQDVGWFAAAAFNRPREFVGQAIEVAGDAVTRPEAVRALRRGGLRPVVGFKVPRVLRGRLPEEYVRMFEWFNRAGFQADLPALRRENPGMLTLQAWVAHPAQPAR